MSDMVKKGSRRRRRTSIKYMHMGARKCKMKIHCSIQVVKCELSIKDMPKMRKVSNENSIEVFFKI